MTINEQAKHVN